MDRKILTTAILGGAFLGGLCLPSVYSAGFAEEGPDYRIKDLDCIEQVEVGGVTWVRVRVENEGEADPGGLLTVTGTQGSSEILLTPEGGLLVFAEPDGRPTEKTFFYSTVTSDEIQWRATFDSDQAFCNTEVRPASDDPPDEEPPGDGDPPAGTLNFIALHDSGSEQADQNCTNSNCHAAVLTEQSLAPDISLNVHVANLPAMPGEDNDEKCAFCHRTVDLRSDGLERKFIRKGVDAGLCAFCHSPVGPALQLYQEGRSSQPDGVKLYGLLCSGCHNGLANSEVKGDDAEKIRDALDENEGGMGPLNFLTAQEIAAIAAALAQVD